MSRPLRIEYPNALHHVVSRGNARQKIFLNEKDYASFLLVLKDVIERYHWICHAYCLMPNHYHLLVETPNANLSLGMRQLNGVYTQKFNFFHKRTGHIFQGRFKSILVEKEAYLFRVIRYVALNPVKAGLSKSPADWKWSSHFELLSQTNKKPVLDRKRALSVFNGLGRYRRFVEQDGADDDIIGEIKGGFVLGSEEFAQEARQHVGRDRMGSIDHARRERYIGRPGLDKLFADAKTGKDRRDEAIRQACLDHGYKLTEAARAASLHVSVVSRILRIKDKVQNAKNKT